MTATDVKEEPSSSDERSDESGDGVGSDVRPVSHHASSHSGGGDVRFGLDGNPDDESLLGSPALASDPYPTEEMTPRAESGCGVDEIGGDVIDVIGCDWRKSPLTRISCRGQELEERACNM